MRILLASHFPPEDSTPSNLIQTELIRGLQAAGHEVRALVVAADPGMDSPVSSSTARVVCHRDRPGADLPFDMPHFATHSGRVRRFADLSDGEIAAYREALRRALDAEIDRFDPNVIHCQHVWLLGHLALESGVPYIVSAHADELAECDLDARYRRFVAEATENAGRVVLVEESLRRRVRALVGDTRSAEIDNRIVVAPASDDEALSNSGQRAIWLVQLYTQVIEERLGET
jgi:hypothetical protein